MLEQLFTTKVLSPESHYSKSNVVWFRWFALFGAYL